MLDLDLYLASRGLTRDFVEPFPRLGSSVGVTAEASGVTKLTYFSPLVDLEVSQITMQTGSSTPSVTLTLGKIGLFEAESNGDCELVARTANDTTLFDTIGEVVSWAFDPTGGYAETYQLMAGSRYAIGVLQIGATAGRSAGIGVLNDLLEPVNIGIKTAQTDIDHDISGVAAAVAGTAHWFRLS